MSRSLETYDNLDYSPLVWFCFCASLASESSRRLPAPVICKIGFYRHRQLASVYWKFPIPDSSQNLKAYQLYGSWTKR
ncbi:hypothetical protein J6590_080242, partial [Homalodisca vitripennis]